MAGATSSFTSKSALVSLSGIPLSPRAFPFSIAASKSSDDVSLKGSLRAPLLTKDAKGADSLPSWLIPFTNTGSKSQGTLGDAKMQPD